jgi:benzodiazapine receptor
VNRDTVRQIVNVIAFIAVVVVNGLATALPLNGQQTGAISDRFAIYFVPAGYVFSIWGLIYLALLGFTIYQALPAQRESPRLRGIGYLFALSCAANIAWLFLWHYNVFVLTLIAMGTLLACLIAIYLRLDIGHTPASTAERWLVNIPFSLYLGWITVATIANVTQVLFYIGWNGFGIGPEIWAVIMLAVAVVVAALMARDRGDIAYLLVLVWAFAGIGVKQAASSLVSTAAWLATALVALMVVWLLVRRVRTSAR